ncbi:MAG: AbrB/MazE/SpoVT family DNA-binding domain-containing protein [Anaerolineales bacterium]|nr:AbrB/MazE/SpoVT family DNA-binding domain-containing protein [Anaerolineales bacterium]
MNRKIFKTGNSVVVSLPKDAIEYLHMDEGTEVNVELDREKRRIVITPAESPLAIAGVDAEFAQQVADFIEQYRPALEELAK